MTVIVVKFERSKIYTHAIMHVDFANFNNSIIAKTSFSAVCILLEFWHDGQGEGVLSN